MSRSILVNQLTEARENFAGLGTRKTKLKLNAAAKTCPIAKAYRIALEIEDCSTLAKKYFGEWKETYYKKKYELILELIKLCQINKWTHGKHLSENYQTKHIIYFELPNCEQISFHCTLPKDIIIPEYQKAWDGKRNSTLTKIEQAITIYFDSQRLFF